MFRYGGVNISIKIDFTLIIALLSIFLIISIGAISATEINETDINSSTYIDDYQIESSNTGDISISDCVSDNDLSKIETENGSYIDNNTETVLNDESNNILSESDNKSNLSANYTVDSAENDLIKQVSSSLESNINESNDSNTLLISSTSLSTNTNSSLSTKTSQISIKSSSIMKGNYLYVILKDSSNKTLSSKNIIIAVEGKKYTKKTDSKGEASLKFNLKPSSYKISIAFLGDSAYKSSYKNFTITVTKITTKLTVASTSIVRGRYLYAYLKDTNGNVLSNKKVIIKFSNKSFSKTTDKNGRVSLQINSTSGNYSSKISFSGDSVYKTSSLSFTSKVYKLKTVITVANTSVVRGKYLYAFLKDSNGNALVNKKVIIKFRSYYFTKYTNANGRVSLKINTYLGTCNVKVSYAGSTSYISSSKSFTAKCYRIATKITVTNTSVLKGTNLYAYLKDSSGKALANKTLTIKIGSNSYKKTTDSNGRVSLKISKNVGSYSSKITFAGSLSYAPSSNSFTVKVYTLKTKITIVNTTVIRTASLTAYLKDSNNKVLKNKSLIINIGGSKYTKTTDSNGVVSLKINLKTGTYSTKVSFSGTTSYVASSKSVNIKVINITTAKIVAKSANLTVNSKNVSSYSITLTDNNGNPISGENVTFTYKYTNQNGGSGTKITQKTIVLDSDNIYSKTKDNATLNAIASILRAKGYKVIVSGIGPNYHVSDVMNYSNVCVFCLFGGVDSGMFVDMSSKYYKYYMSTNKNSVVLGFLSPPVTRNLATDSWLERAHDDDYSAANFTGLSYPGNYLNSNGFNYVYGSSATELANNFLKYAVNGLSVGLNNSKPLINKTVTVKTNSNGVATLSNLEAGNYTITISCGNNLSGNVADSVTTTITIK